MKDEKNYHTDAVPNILVSRRVIKWVAHNLEFTNHASFNIINRDSIFNRDFKKSVHESPLAWKQTDGRIAIALNLFEYIIVEIDNNKATVITFINTKDSKEDGDNVVYRMFKDYRNFLMGGFDSEK